MKKCHKCGAELLDNARFCHNCGTKVLAETINCPSCQTENPIDAKFCGSCGFDFFGKGPRNNIFESPPTAESESELTERFSKIFKDKVLQEQNEELLPVYLERFESSGFKPNFELRIRQLAEQLQRIRLQSIRPQTEAEALMRSSLNGLSDYFFIHYCKDINIVKLPEEILQYENATLDTIDLFQMVMDYLAFEDEPEESVYLNFLQMPVEKLRNAGKSFFFPEKDERIFFLCDQSLLGSLKEGYAMTGKAIYWKAPFEKPRKVLYTNLTEITREKEWIRINDLFFNATLTLNVRMMKLLTKIRELVGQ